ncbi:MAG: ROK family protein [Spirochaetes bacterium]|nr:ROK family protein [Spirochaetota bacterium]
MAKLKSARFINSSRVLRDIWIHKETSRIQIARNLGLDKSTISSIIPELLRIGIVHETTEGEAGPQGGRKPVLITLNRSYGCVVGIEMRPESYNAVAVDLEGSVIYSKFELAQVSGANFREVLLEVANRVREELKRTGVPLLGLGVGVAGVVDPQHGLIKYSIPLQMTESFDFRSAVAEGYDLPIFVENDANACAWGELAFHRDKRLRNFLFVLVEFRDLHDQGRIYERTGVGMGIVIGGRVHYGRDFSAGEFRSVFRTPANKGQFSLSEEDSFRLEEDPAVLARFFRELSRNIAMLVNTFNLDHVFLGGDIERYEGEIQPVLAEEIQFNWPYPGGVHCAVRFSSLGEKAVAYGAAGMVLHRLFADLDIAESIGRVVPGLPAALAMVDPPRAAVRIGAS